MKISELIEALKALQSQHGDITVSVYQYTGGDKELCDISPIYSAFYNEVILDSLRRW